MDVTLQEVNKGVSIATIGWKQNTEYWHETLPDMNAVW